MEDFGFKKIDIKAPNLIKHKDDMSKKKSLPKINKVKKIYPILAGVLAVFLVFIIFVAIRAKTVYSDAQTTAKQAKAAFSALKQQNVVLAKEELVKTQADISILKKDLNSLSFLKFIPLANFYYNDAQHLVNASSYGVSAGISVVDSLIPYADVLGLKGTKSFVGGSAEERIQTAIKSLGKIVPGIDNIEADLTRAQMEIDQVDPNHYPNISKLKEVKAQLAQLKILTDQGVVAIRDAKPLIKVLPAVLGEPDSKKYLVLFQNDKELRPTGGFLTFYALFRLEHGMVRADTASDIYNLDDTISSHPPAPEIIRNYLPKENVLFIRNANLSPDYIESMKTFTSLYEKSSQKTKIDGIIALDTDVLVHVLDILGDVNAGGVTFNSKTDPRCNCPQVVYMLESFADLRVGHIVENRKSIIGELLYAIMGKSLSSSPKEYWGRLFQSAMTDAQQKHILIYLFNNDAQSGIEALNLAGRIKNFEGDYLHINDSNFGGAKSNMYVNQSVKVEYNVDSDKKITKTLTIDYKNPYQASDCNLERGGLCLNGILRNYIRVYVPKGSVLLDSKGSEVKVGQKEDLDKTVFDGFLEVRPEGKSQIMFKYQLPFKLQRDSSLPVLVQKQPGTDNVSYDVYVNGNKTETFVLSEDKNISLKNF
ncbi:MAG: hypothetical protein A2857_00430 [Candidatus Levybacteria bacterium RIFCSPHIGHO2_01_FULL_36_15]|nr:MAG: hypothetical protein A2857_00430 [Candidatus Levybacteria bacterium RIFCSPHIGHO2_01_FULL_36_15]OGH38838.1 MAG: hypothetical protein A2905_03010 [Candidatus Levybacteria bacterium RIFCSPLOWO2_01_FULL_36_10]